MTEEHRLPPDDDDDDDDDEDYVPEAAVNSASEVESDGEPESEPDEESGENKRQGKCKGKSRVKTSERDRSDEQENKEETKLTEEEEKKRADSLWADFMKDTGTVTSAGVPRSTPKPSPNPEGKSQKIKITKVFEFAGEEVKVEKEVPIDSSEARDSGKTEDTPSVKPSRKAGSVGVGRGVKRGGGITSVLGQLGKRAKISTLEKSKLDWDNYKRQENLEEEISSHNRGKGGYLERQDFLQRADLRQFEIEKRMRSNNRKRGR